MHCGERTQNGLAGLSVAPSLVQMTKANVRLAQQGEQLESLTAMPVAQALFS